MMSTVVPITMMCVSVVIITMMLVAFMTICVMLIRMMAVFLTVAVPVVHGNLGGFNSSKSSTIKLFVEFLNSNHPGALNTFASRL